MIASKGIQVEIGVVARVCICVEFEMDFDCIIRRITMAIPSKDLHGH